MDCTGRDVGRPVQGLANRYMEHAAGTAQLTKLGKRLHYIFCLLSLPGMYGLHGCARMVVLVLLTTLN